jgi:predicted short-subunit dehydrogenase-like oxidoreductase (DUF2520 family)
MKAQNKISVTIAGSGNVGTFLATHLFDSGCIIKQVFSRTFDNALRLAEKVNSQPITEISQVLSDVDLLIVALPDNIIPIFCHELYESNKNDSLTVVSVAGSVELENISRFYLNAGVMYPLQTITIYTKPDPRIIPICIEATNEKSRQLISEVSGLISDDLRYLDSKQRLSLHLAAVFASNFTNHMVAVAEDLLEKAGLDADILIPLLHETIKRLDTNRAIQVQTGPALRGDHNTINKHIAVLEKENEFRLVELYNLISESIFAFSKNKQNQ